jgi:hypothetical protein
MSKALFRKALLIFIASVLVITSCKQSDLLPPAVPVNPVTNDAILVTASVSGVILDEKNQPIQGAVVVSGASTTNTNTQGMFSLRNIQLSEQNGSVTVTKAGFFTGVRSFKTTAGKDHMVKLQLMQKLLSGTIKSSSGGIVNSNNGATINFPVDAFVSNSGAVYNGPVKVYSCWIDPTANNLSFIVPGDLRGLTISGIENILVTYGMVGAELEDAAGNPLKLSPSKKATVNFPLPASLQGSAPQTIALWHFDNATARWKEEGTAVKSGSTYTALVDKFSFWNCDRGIDGVELDFTLINSITNTPLIGTSTRLKPASLYSYGYGTTNNTGFVKGVVPRNAAMLLEVIGGDCQTVIYSQNIGPFSSNNSLGNINVIIPASKYLNFTGTITNCSGAPVTNGYVSLAGSGGNSGFANTNASGNFSFSILNCTGNNFVYSFMGVDNATTQESTVSTGTASTGSVSLGTLNACSTPSSLNIYISGFQRSASTPFLEAKVWKNSAASLLSDVTKQGMANGLFVVGNDVYVAGVEQNNGNTSLSTACVWKNGSVLYTLSNGTTPAQANDVAVSGSDVYVTGSVAGAAKVWKNGIATTLGSGTGGDGKAITIVGNDVYVAGTDNNEGKVWKNNVLLFSTSGQNAQFNAVFVSGSDVYTAGTLYTGSDFVATVWKNGVGTALFNAYLDRSAAYGLFVSGTDVYVAGEEGITNTTAKIWKNGTGTNLTNGAAFAKAVDVVVKNNDVYVLGRSSTSTDLIIVLWKNGLPVNITNSGPDAYPAALVVQ